MTPRLLRGPEPGRMLELCFALAFWWTDAEGLRVVTFKPPPDFGAEIEMVFAFARPEYLCE